MFIDQLRSALAIPAIYRHFARCVGGVGPVQTLVKEYIRPRQGDRVLDIGCGPADILDFLGAVEYTGFDLSEKYINAGKRKYGARAQLFCQPLTRDTLPHAPTFDLVLAIGVLHHLSDSEALDLFQLAFAVLKPGGRLITLDGCYVEGQSRVARFLLARDRGRFVRSVEHYARLAKQVFPQPVFSIRHDLLRIPFTHLITQSIR